ncbi:TetR/AcrR family transcriptional regulator [Gordonia sp. CPCC 205333]|uniref:TetR/AcrR family transcriptional regulator n=1 Tax=Gordonia sp. CPCC 205333 TaxID=3140790 RepID=UPI003AF3D35A
MDRNAGDGAADAARRAGRPRQRVLSREKIVAGAMSLLAQGGPARLTIATLADRLGVAPSAIYNHVGSKRELMILVQDHLIEGVDFGGFAEADWAEGVRRWARSARDVFAVNAHMVPTYAVMPVADSRAVLKMYDTLVSGFAAAGWPRGSILSAIVAVESFVLGAALDANAPDGVFDVGALAIEYPALSAEASKGEAEQSVSRADRAFDLGLDALIVGLESMFTGALAALARP